MGGVLSHGATAPSHHRFQYIYIYIVNVGAEDLGFGELEIVGNKNRSGICSILRVWF